MESGRASGSGRVAELGPGAYLELNHQRRERRCSRWRERQGAACKRRLQARAAQRLFEDLEVVDLV